MLRDMISSEPRPLDGVKPWALAQIILFLLASNLASATEVDGPWFLEKVLGSLVPWSFLLGLTSSKVHRKSSKATTSSKFLRNKHNV